MIDMQNVQTMIDEAFDCLANPLTRINFGYQRITAERWETCLGEDLFFTTLRMVMAGYDRLGILDVLVDRYVSIRRLFTIHRSRG